MIGGELGAADPRRVHLVLLSEEPGTRREATTHEIRMRRHVPATFEMADEGAARELLSEIRLLATRCPPEPDRSKRILLVMNPHGGRGKRAVAVTRTTVQPLLHAAGIQCDVIETAYAGEAPSTPTRTP